MTDVKSNANTCADRHGSPAITHWGDVCPGWLGVVYAAPRMRQIKRRAATRATQETLALAQRLTEWPTPTSTEIALRVGSIAKFLNVAQRRSDMLECSLLGTPDLQCAANGFVGTLDA